MKIVIIGSLVCFIKNKSIVFTIKSKWLARLLQMFRSKKSIDQL
jgi:hypothetical protein